MYLSGDIGSFMILTISRILVRVNACVRSMSKKQIIDIIEKSINLKIFLTSWEIMINLNL